MNAPDWSSIPNSTVLILAFLFPAPTMPINVKIENINTIAVW